MTTKEKLIKEISNLPDDKVMEIYKLINSIKKSGRSIAKLQTFELGGKYDNIDIRKAAYEKTIRLNHSKRIY